MRSMTFAVGVFLVGCAHSRQEGVATIETGSSGPSTEVTTAPPVLEAAPPPRPRLSRTITLGQMSDPQLVPAPPAQAQAAPSQTVIVNNNIVVHSPPASYGYGYGGYGRPTTHFNEGRGSRTSGGWGASGWEGARRTAAPGQTPAVGGNWSPPPSFGPKAMQ